MSTGVFLSLCGRVIVTFYNKTKYKNFCLTFDYTVLATKVEEWGSEKKRF